ncbi:MAG: threonine--tRNA ligase, partial [Candidatus Krumholzibacteriota bacterium]|nr:threonine--tRNA ligase [Candidatus Krumholzibacteriota bacterium]
MILVRVTLPDGSEKTFEGNEVAVSEVVASFGDAWRRNAVAVLYDGQIKDVYQTITGEGELRLLRDSDEESLYVLRHTASHVLAHAVQELFPDVRFAIGPPIENGFYYDFEVKEPFTPEDLAKIEKRMKELLSAGLTLEREDWSKERAREYFGGLDQPYKIELIDGIEGNNVSIYTVGNFVDLCAGPHVDRAKRIKAFKLLSSAGAYWRGDSSRTMLQRIYATAFFKKKDLDQYLEQLAEAEKRDHRRLGKALDLFDIKEEAGAGLVFWLPKGAVVRSVIEDYLREEYRRRGYQLVYTPHIAKAELWNTSGHLHYYRDQMFMMDVEGHEYVVKPMNCPGHILVYKRRLHSYRELPVRLAEMGTVYRNELSGTLHGLFRVRGFTQDDAHIFCTPEQLPDEVDASLDFALDVLRTFGFEKFDLELSVRDPDDTEKYAGSDEDWEMAESALEDALRRKSLPHKRMDGEAVFYGPKIDIKVKDAIGREWQLCTIQLDFNLPRRFGVKYRDSSGRDEHAVIIHRALIGSFERFFGVLIEHYAGA